MKFLLKMLIKWLKIGFIDECFQLLVIDEVSIDKMLIKQLKIVYKEIFFQVNLLKEILIFSVLGNK